MTDYFKFSPGDNASLWDNMLNLRIASIGWWNHDYTNKSTEQIAKVNPELSGRSIGIIGLFNQIKPGDIIVAFKGRQKIIGYGIVKSGQKYSAELLHPGSIHHNYIEVDWHQLTSVFQTQSFFAIDSLSKITDRFKEFSEIFTPTLPIASASKTDTSKHEALGQDINSPVLTLNDNAPTKLIANDQIKDKSDYKIFISYRREDEARYLVPTIAEKLNQRYGPGTAFYDVDNIPLGVDFREYLKSAIEKSHIVLVLMGKDWFGHHPDGSRRIDRPNDFVRIEVESALGLGKIVIPVLAGNASMPQENELPESISSLAFRNGTRISSGADYNSHFNTLLSSIDPLIRK